MFDKDAMEKNMHDSPLSEVILIGPLWGAFCVCAKAQCQVWALELDRDRGRKRTMVRPKVETLEQLKKCGVASLE